MCTTDSYRARKIPEDEPGRTRQSLVEKGVGDEPTVDAEDVSASAHLHEAVEGLKKYRSMR